MDLQQLINEATPGSIWMRTDGSRARVLAITNLSLPTESQQKYVPVVVYIGPSGKVFSRPLKDFAGYFPTWLGHDTGAEKVIKSLLTPLNATKAEPVESSDDDSIDMSDDAPSAPAAPRAKPAVQVREKVAVTAATPLAPNLLRAAFQIGNDEARKTPAITADQLSRALRVYSQVPDEHLGLVVHKLSFELSPNLTITHITEAFAPDEWVNTVDAFRIGTPVSDETVNVDAYIGVYPEYTRNVLYGTVYVGVDMVPASNQLTQSHVHTQVTATHTSAPDEVQPEVVSPKPEEPPVPSADSVDEAPYSEEVAAVESPTPAAEPIPQPESRTVGVQAIPEGAVVAESSSTEPEAPIQPVKVKKKRGPKKKVVEPAPVADDDLDVESLS
jgi:hypothetical protein